MSSLSPSKTKEVLLMDAIKEGNQKQVYELLVFFNNKEKVEDQMKNGIIYFGLISIKPDLQDSEEKKRREKIVKDLIKSKFPINTKNQVGKTPLHKAVKKELFEIIELLINKGADLNAKNDDGETPLHLALKRGSEKITELLIKRGADVNIKNKEGETPLFLTVSERNLNLFECLIRSPKIDLNTKVKSPFRDNEEEMNIFKVLKNSITLEQGLGRGHEGQIQGQGQEENSRKILLEMLKKLKEKEIGELNTKMEELESQMKEMKEVFKNKLKGLDEEIENKRNEVATLSQEIEEQKKRNESKNKEVQSLNSEIKILMMIKEDNEKPERTKLEMLRNKHKEISSNLRESVYVELNSNDKVKKEQIEMIRLELRFNNNQITTLNLNQNNIGEEGTKSISSVLKYNNSLTLLSLGSNNIGDEGVKSIADSLKINTSLTELNLGGNKIGDEGLKSIVDSLKINTSLRELHLGSNNSIKDDQTLNYIRSKLAQNRNNKNK